MDLIAIPDFAAGKMLWIVAVWCTFTGLKMNLGHILILYCCRFCWLAKELAWSCLSSDWLNASIFCLITLFRLVSFLGAMENWGLVTYRWSGVFLWFFFKNKLIMSIAVALRPKVVPIFHSTALERKLVNVCHYKLILFPLVSFFVYTNGAFLTSSKQNFVYFFRETALLVDPENSSSAAKQWVALVVGESDFFKFNHL